MVKLRIIYHFGPDVWFTRSKKALVFVLFACVVFNIVLFLQITTSPKETLYQYPSVDHANPNLADAEKQEQEFSASESSTPVHVQIQPEVPQDNTSLPDNRAQLTSQTQSYNEPVTQNFTELQPEPTQIYNLPDNPSELAKQTESQIGTTFRTCTPSQSRLTKIDDQPKVTLPTQTQSNSGPFTRTDARIEPTLTQTHPYKPDNQPEPDPHHQSHDKPALQTSTRIQPEMTHTQAYTRIRSGITGTGNQAKNQVPTKTPDQVATDSPKNNKSRTGTELEPESACPKMTIHGEEDEQEIEALTKDTVCRPHVPSEEACQFTADLFTAPRWIATCQDQKGPPYQLCRISEQHRKGKLSTLKVKCDLSACDRRFPMSVEVLGPSDGEMWFIELPGKTSKSQMQRVIEKAAKETRKNGFNFLFVDCVGLKYRENISQLLTLLPPDKVFKSNRMSSEEKVNVNVVLLDSISRPHFYRSLPKTVEYLREKQADPSYDAHIFDFERFQSVHGHTHENEHALFSGTLYPENYTKSNKEDAPTDLGILCGIFKEAGYQTMIHNDMCWKTSYGLIESTKADDWVSLQEKIKQANIDSTGITEASCKILGRNSLDSPFRDMGDHQICFNGKHQHRHLLDYLTYYLDGVSTAPDSKPLFSYTETNVAHDNVGIRVQTLDRDLMEFIDRMAKERNTVTIIFADHGNTYTYYQTEMQEGRFEMYHPIMLTILPKQLGERFGQEVLRNLKTNQFRLMNLFDIRAGLVELAKYDARAKLNPVGIFGEISPQRTCDDLQLSTPNFCICEGWDFPVENSTVQMALAEFAIGQVNNQIQDSLLKSRENITQSSVRVLFGSCQRLRIRSIENVRQRQTAAGTLVTTLDAKLQSGNIVDQEEVIMLQVESNQRSERSSFEMKLVSFTRISEYGFYKECADAAVALQVCICNRPTASTPHTKKTDKSRVPLIYGVVDRKSRIRKLTPCLYLIHRSYQENERREDFVGLTVYEIANVCNDKRYTVTFRAKTENVRSATELPQVVALQARSVYFVTFMMTEVGYYRARVKLRCYIEEDDVDENE